MEAPLPVRFPIGISDFRAVREGQFAYVDKTSLIADIVTENAQVILAPRPRRFGKTLNLSMLRCFFENTTEDRRGLFDGLAVRSSPAAWPHFGRHPVIFMTFKDVKPRTWEECLAGIARVLGEAFEEHLYLLSDAPGDPFVRRLFSAIRERKATQSELTGSLLFLSRVLANHHGRKVVILIDEYDTPIHAGYTNRYYDDVIAFFRDFLSAGLKDNPHLWKGVLTGILRVARESLFSGLNNIDVFSLLREELSTAFGFTDREVQSLAEASGQAARMDILRASYNGYDFGGHAIYNPWSVLSFLSRGDGVFRPYWIETSSNDLVRELLITGARGVRADLEVLLQGGTIEKEIDENIVLRDVALRSDAVWSFLLFTGYLKAVEARFIEGRQWAKLAIPNAEVSLALTKMVETWLADQAGGSDELPRLFAALLGGDADALARHLGQMAKTSFSFFDTADPRPERFFHGFVVGLLVGLQPKYEVRSNRESGYGRCDILVLPRAPGDPGVVIELKAVDASRGETADKALGAALRQIRQREYATELVARGATPIHLIAAAFEGKQVFVRAAKHSARPPKAQPIKSAGSGRSTLAKRETSPAKRARASENSAKRKPRARPR